MTTAAFIGLGSNVGDRLAHLRSAVSLLDDSEGVTFVRASPVYETEPVGPPQPDFLNAVIEVHTTLAPVRLLGRLKEVEREVGRQERDRWGPREVDLDLLLFGSEVLDEEGLRAPHPEMTARAFVLVPLCDIAPFARIPGGRMVAEHAEAVDRSGVRRAHRPEAIWP